MLIAILDGTGGCDGCLNWHGVTDHVEDHIADLDKQPERWYTVPAVNRTDNNGLLWVVEAMERIYTTIDWPFTVRSDEILLFKDCNVAGGPHGGQPAAAGQVPGRPVAVCWTGGAGEIPGEGQQGVRPGQVGKAAGGL